MKLALTLFVATFAALQARADVTPMACSYKPTATLAEALPMNPNSLYLDVESPKVSFMLFAPLTATLTAEAAHQNLLADAQARITAGKVQSGTVYVFSRDEDTKAIVQVNAIENGLIVVSTATPIDFTGAAPVNGQSVVSLPNGISCAYGEYVAPPKADKKRR